jgi:tetratricopeptide (TPR) repeat protein
LIPKIPCLFIKTALAALVGLNQSHQAIERFEEIFDHLPLYQDDIVPWSYYHYIDALNRTGQYEKASDFYLDLPESIKVTLWGRSARYAMFALIYQGRIEDVINLLEKRGSKQEEYLQAAFMYRYVFPKKRKSIQSSACRETGPIRRSTPS